MHDVPATEFVHTGTPLMHEALMHGPQTGRFVSSAAVPQTPPMHEAFWHEPAGACGHWEAVVHWAVTQVPFPSHVPPAHALPATLFMKPHVPLLHVADLH